MYIINGLTPWCADPLSRVEEGKRMYIYIKLYPKIPNAMFNFAVAQKLSLKTVYIDLELRQTHFAGLKQCAAALTEAGTQVGPFVSFWRC